MNDEYDPVRAQEIIAHCKSQGWADAYGGPEENGMYWRGTSPVTGRVEEIPETVLESLRANRNSKGQI